MSFVPSTWNELTLGMSLLLTSLSPAAATADVRPHALISDGMVLQQERAVSMWGTADAGERIAIRFRDQEISTTASDDGKWSVRIESKSAGGPFGLTIRGNNTLTFDDVFVGEVWVASGQSNMWWPVASRPGSKELVGTENPSIRLFTVPSRLSDAPQHDVASRWQECNPNSLVGFSAVAYYFGRQIQATQNVPIGLIHASYGGSGIEAWTSAEALAEDPELDAYRRKRTQAAEQVAANRERIQPEINRYLASLAEAKKNGTTPPEPPRGMIEKPASHSRLYNGMIAPLLPFGIRGVIWYQGEANVGRAGDYASLFSTLIRSWRRAWGQGAFPFLFVQLAPFQKIVDQPQESDWARLREAQLQTSLTIPRTGMAVITDWGHETDIHVKQKEPVGERLALVARALVYGEKLTYSGPLYTGVKFDGERAVLRFTHLGAGLTTKRLVLEDARQDSRAGNGGALHVARSDDAATPVPLQGFTIAGDDLKFVPALAEIRGATVVVHGPLVAKPAAVRYGWADYPTGNLFNAEGLPASPFRTDDWSADSETPKANLQRGSL